MTGAQASARSRARFRPWAFNDWSLRPKLLAALLAASLIPILLFAAVGTAAAMARQQAMSGRLLAQASAATAERIDTILSDQLDYIAFMSQLPDIVAFGTTPDKSSARALALKELTLAAAQRGYVSVAVIDPRGTVLLSSAGQEINTNVKSHPSFIQAVEGTAVISDPGTSVVTSQPALFFTSPIYDETGNIIAVLRGAMSFDSIWDVVEQDKDAAGPGTVGMLLDENGIRLAHTLSKGNRASAVNELLFRAVAPVPQSRTAQVVAEGAYGKATTDGVPVLPLPQLAAALAGSRGDVFTTGVDRSTEPHQASAVGLRTKPWRYVLMVPSSTFAAASNELIPPALFLGLISCTLAVVGALFVAQILTQPIVRLTRVAERISLGELDAKVEIHRKDEIGELADAVVRMQASLQAAIERLRARRSV